MASDEEVAAAVAFAFAELKLVVEPGGAVALAALMTGKVDIKNKVAVAVLSGGNVDPEVFSRLVAARAQLWRRSRGSAPAPAGSNGFVSRPSASWYGQTTAGPKRLGSVTTAASGTTTHCPWMRTR